MSVVCAPWSVVFVIPAQAKTDPMILSPFPPTSLSSVSPLGFLISMPSAVGVL